MRFNSTCVCVCLRVHMITCTLGCRCPWRSEAICLMLVLRTVVSCLIWVLGIQLGPSVNAVYRVISPAPTCVHIALYCERGFWDIIKVIEGQPHGWALDQINKNYAEAWVLTFSILHHSPSYSMESLLEYLHSYCDRILVQTLWWPSLYINVLPQL